MQLDENNKIIKLCAQGMGFEAADKPEEAYKIFLEAWEEASNNNEKFIAAHYVARHQKSIVEKLEWDKTSLQLALKINDESTKGALPSLYLNIAKCYEDLNDFDKAKEYYQIALSYSDFLSDDGYGKLIKNGILNGIKRVDLK